MEKTNKKFIRGEQETRKFIKNNKNFKLIIGAFGEMDNCTGIVEEIIEPKSGGIFSKLLGCSYLYKGYPNMGVVKELEALKTMIKVSYSLFGSWVLQFVLFFLFIFRRSAFRQYLLDFFEACFKNCYIEIERSKLDPAKLCVSVKELYRVSNLLIDEIEDKQIKTVACHIRDAVCSLLEYDAAYRFRLQDILYEIDIGALRENPIKELHRVFEILYNREVVAEGAGMKAKYKKIEKLFLILRVSRKARRMVVRFICELDMDKIKLDEADWYFCLQRDSYNFRGVDIEGRLRAKTVIDNKKGHFRPKIVIEQAPVPVPQVK